LLARSGAIVAVANSRPRPVDSSTATREEKIILQVFGERKSVCSTCDKISTVKTYINLVVLARLGPTSYDEGACALDRDYDSLVLLIRENMTSDSVLFPSERVTL
jgi:hypothetical protein